MDLARYEVQQCLVGNKKQFFVCGIFPKCNAAEIEGRPLAVCSFEPFILQ
jgi:hypothetical protein